MNGTLILLLLALFPMLCAPLAWALGRKDGQQAIWAMVGASAVEVAVLALLLGNWIFASRQSDFAGCAFTWDGFLGMGVRMELDGFRGLYALIASGMWLVTSLFSRDYLRHDHAAGPLRPVYPDHPGRDGGPVFERFALHGLPVL